jgi:hypothetical protein
MQHDDALAFWVIYKNPKDCPGRYVLRKQYATREGVVVDKDSFVAIEPQELREQMPPGLVKIGPQPGDDPVILEVWV